MEKLTIKGLYVLCFNTVGINLNRVSKVKLPTLLCIDSEISLQKSNSYIMLY